MSQSDRILVHVKGNTTPIQSGSMHTDAALDEALKQTFPASDPIAINISTVARQTISHVGTVKKRKG